MRKQVIQVFLAVAARAGRCGWRAGETRHEEAWNKAKYTSKRDD